MIAKGCLLGCLVVLFCTEISSRDCSRFQERLQEANKGNLQLLRSKMNPIVYMRCVDNGTTFSSNEDMLRRINTSLERNAKVAIQEILQQTALIFSQNYTDSGWDENSMEVFQKRLDEQIKDLKNCLRPERQDGIISSRQQHFQLTRPRVQILSHFQRIRAFLRGEQFSRCGWESVQIEVRQCFLLIDQLIQTIHQ